MKIKRLLFCCSFLMCLLLSSAFSGICSAASYSIQEQELVRLESNLIRLQEYNNRSQQELVALKTQLKTSQEQLQKAKEQSIRLQLQLVELTEKSVQAEKSLEIANQSLQQFRAEEQKKLSKYKRQRNIWLAIAVTGIVAGVAK